jgi:flagellar L-ring protein precursor FlgH
MNGRFASRSSLVTLAALLVVATPAGAQSLWTPRAGSLVTDVRGTRAGDLVTILVDEQSTADKSGETKLNRNSDFATSIIPPSGAGPITRILDRFSLSGKGNSDYDGKASTTRSDRATGQITAKIMRVLDNGNLVIEGRRLVVANDEAQTLVVSGVVRSQDVGPDNTVRSSAIADAEVRLEGRGTVSDRQRPGYLQRLFDLLGLF